MLNDTIHIVNIVAEINIAFDFIENSSVNTYPTTNNSPAKTMQYPTIDAIIAFLFIIVVVTNIDMHPAKSKINITDLVCDSCKLFDPLDITLFTLFTLFIKL
jgi:hypothetical protein